jgi:hypothetical protein
MTETRAQEVRRIVTDGFASLERPAVSEGVSAKLDETQAGDALLRSFADMYRSGEQGAQMDYDAAQALALAIDEALASQPLTAETGAVPSGFVKQSSLDRLADMHSGSCSVEMANIAFGACTVPLYARPQGIEAIDVDDLAQIIRRVDGDNSLGAGALAEAILSALTGKE